VRVPRQNMILGAKFAAYCLRSTAHDTKGGDFIMPARVVQAVRKSQRLKTQDIAHRMLRVLKLAGLPQWKIWPRYALTGLT
jgi:hypothetical protein